MHTQKDGTARYDARKIVLNRFIYLKGRESSRPFLFATLFSDETSFDRCKDLWENLSPKEERDEI